MGEYRLGTVSKILEETTIPGNSEHGKFYTQKVLIELEDGSETEISVGNQFQPINETQRLQVNRQVIVATQGLANGESELVLRDVYRLPIVWGLSTLFIITVLIVGRMKGLLSLIGMIASIFVLIAFIIPQILSGSDPMFTALIGSLAIAAVTIYISHGISLKSHLALASLGLTLLVVTFLSDISVTMAQLVGLGSEEAYFLQFGETASINLQGLLLGGIVLGALGVLDDVTVSQVSIVYQLKALKNSISFRELYTRAIEVGRDHVASLVNTLVLAYAGANLPLFLLLLLDKETPLWVILNSEVLVEEIVRTLVGSIGLILAVPLTTALSAFYIHSYKKKLNEPEEHLHHH